MTGGGSRARVVAGVLAVVVLVGVVAVASTGSTPSGTGDSRPPSELVLDTVFSLALLALIPGAVLLVYVLLQRGTVEELAAGRNRRLVWVGLLLFLPLAWFMFRNRDFRLGGDAAGVEVGGEPPSDPGMQGGDERVYEAEFAWIPVAVIVALAALAVGAYVVASRRRQPAERTLDEVAEEVAGSLEDGLDDLRAEPDARRAVVAAYARLERALASAGLPRRSAETAREYVVRVLDRVDVDPVPVRRLTDLYTTAKFSLHDVDAAMKEEAIAALERIRNDLRDVARRAAEQRARPIGEAAAS